MSMRTVFATTALSVMLAASPSLAETINFTADLSGASEVPANESAGTGTVEAAYDTETMMFNWTVTFDGLSGPATAAHFHGPAAEGENAPPVVPLSGDLSSPIEGNATLTAEQADQLQSGMWYFNIHTAKYPDGELRGQVMKADMMDSTGENSTGASSGEMSTGTPAANENGKGTTNEEGSLSGNEQNDVNEESNSNN